MKTYKMITEKEVVVKEPVERDLTIYQYMGEKLKAARQAKGLNMTEVSYEMKNRGFEISNSTVGNIEDGMKNVKLFYIINMCEYYELTFSDILPAEAIFGEQQEAIY